MQIMMKLPLSWQVTAVCCHFRDLNLTAVILQPPENEKQYLVGQCGGIILNWCAHVSSNFVFPFQIYEVFFQMQLSSVSSFPAFKLYGFCKYEICADRTLNIHCGLYPSGLTNIETIFPSSSASHLHVFFFLIFVRIGKFLGADCCQLKWQTSPAAEQIM